MHAAYKALVEKHKLDTVIVVDGGTDSLMDGTEEGLGTPTEDMTTIAAVQLLDSISPERKLLTCLGMGVDCFHGVNHHLFLENTAALQRTGDFLGAFSLLPQQQEAQWMMQAYAACNPVNSIVTSSVASAVEVCLLSLSLVLLFCLPPPPPPPPPPVAHTLFSFPLDWSGQGRFGNYHSPHTKARTQGSHLYITPLMSLFWSYNLPAVAKRIGYLNLPQFLESESHGQVRKIIVEWREGEKAVGARK